MTLTFNPLWAVVMSYPRAKVQGRQSLSSEWIEVDRWTDGWTEVIALPDLLVQLVINVLWFVGNWPTHRWRASNVKQVAIWSKDLRFTSSTLKMVRYKFFDCNAVISKSQIISHTHISGLLEKYFNYWPNVKFFVKMDVKIDFQLKVEIPMFDALYFRHNHNDILVLHTVIVHV